MEKARPRAPKPLRFGVLLNLEYYPEVHGPTEVYYEQILQQVELLESLGYDAAWFGEHHYARYSFGNPAVIAAVAATRTKRIRLGTGVSLVPLHNPLVLAQEYAMLDVLSGGRLDYGVGKGYLNYAYDVLGVSLAESTARYREGLALIEKAWRSDGPISFDGDYIKLTDYEFFPKPLQKPIPPIYSAAARTAESFSWAGQNGYHLSTALFAPDQAAVRTGIRHYFEALTANGHDPSEFEVAGVLQMYCAPTKAEAMRDGGRHVQRYYGFFERLRQLGTGAGSRNDFVIDPVQFDRENRVLFGSPAELVERIEQIRDETGLTLMLFEVAHGGTSYDAVRETLELFGREVLPSFRHAAANERPQCQA